MARPLSLARVVREPLPLGQHCAETGSERAGQTGADWPPPEPISASISLAGRRAGRGLGGAWGGGRGFGMRGLGTLGVVWGPTVTLNLVSWASVFYFPPSTPSL